MKRASRSGLHFSPAAMRKPERKERKCMRCRKPFMSVGSHNRLCKDCRSNTGPTEYKLCL